LQLSLTKLAFLPTDKGETSNNELIVVRNILELAVEFSVMCQDNAAFERYMSQLKCYYYDYRFNANTFVLCP